MRIIVTIAIILSVACSNALAQNSEDDIIKRGQNYLQKKAYERAIGEFTEAININSQNPRTYFARALAYFNKGDKKQSLADCTKALELAPDFPDAYNLRGAILTSQGLASRAIIDYTKAIALAPESPYAYNNRGLAYREIGKLDDAIFDLTKAIELGPRYAVAYKNRAIAYSMKKEFDLARRDAEKAEELGLNMPPDFLKNLDTAGAIRSVTELVDNTKNIHVTRKGGFMGIGFLLILIVLGIFLAGIRIVRPTHRGLVERLGKYIAFADPGFHWIIPVIDNMYQVNVTEQMVDAEPQEIITNDNLNARVDAQVYFRVKADEASVKNSQYSVNNYRYQIVNLARTTLRNIIGTLTLKSANSERGKINSELHKTLCEETQNWGIDIVRTELKEIDPPKDVQETMNKVVKAENEKIAAVDFATATETAADGARRAEIKKAEGVKQAKILAAQGEAEAIRLVNEAAEKYFVGNAQVLRRLETVETALKNNAKIVVPSSAELINVVGEMAGVLPIKTKDKETV